VLELGNKREDYCPKSIEYVDKGVDVEIKETFRR
jgi:hypothetical protein